MRIVIRVDSDPGRQALFANLVRSRWPVRAVYHVHQRLAGTRAAAWLVSLYGLAAFLCIALPQNRQARIVTLAIHENARRQVARIAAWVAADACGAVRTGAAGVTMASVAALWTLAVNPRRIAQVLRLLSAIDRRHGFLVGCRAASAVGWYVRTGVLLAEHRPGAVLVSSDTNPEEAGFAAAARALGISRIFASHAYPTPLSPPLDFTLSILEGEAAVEALRAKGPIGGRIVFGGVEGESSPMDAGRYARPNPVIGIFAPKAVSWAALASLVDECRRLHHPRQIVIRWHPSRIETIPLDDVLGDVSGLVESPHGAPLTEVARICDWVIGDENSNVHLPVLKLGIPTVPIRTLGLYRTFRSDQYGFAAHGIVYPPVESLSDVRAAALTAFFSAGWAERFTRYDAAYLRPAAEVGAEVGQAVRAVLDGGHVSVQET
ncbi:MAG: hypothetical protein FJW23_16170 [Acidimicrobiia bacterium]|nr:hypothetical protein [Acidimicrobiia bacterium]